MIENLSKYKPTDDQDFNFEILREFAKLEDLAPEQSFESLLKPTFKQWSSHITEVLTKATKRSLKEETWQIKSGKLHSISCHNFISLLTKVFEPVRALILEKDNSFTRIMKSESGKLLAHKFVESSFECKHVLQKRIKLFRKEAKVLLKDNDSKELREKNFATYCDHVYSLCLRFGNIDYLQQNIKNDYFQSFTSDKLKFELDKFALQSAYRLSNEVSTYVAQEIFRNCFFKYIFLKFPTEQFNNYKTEEAIKNFQYSYYYSVVNFSESINEVVRILTERIPESLFTRVKVLNFVLEKSINEFCLEITEPRKIVYKNPTIFSKYIKLECDYLKNLFYYHVFLSIMKDIININNEISKFSEKTSTLIMYHGEKTSSIIEMISTESSLNRDFMIRILMCRRNAKDSIAKSYLLKNVKGSENS